MTSSSFTEKIGSELLTDGLDAALINRIHLLKVLSRFITAGHVVLEDIIDEGDVAVDPLVHDPTNTEGFLPAETKFEHAAVLSQTMQVLPVGKWFISNIKRFIDGFLQNKKSIGCDQA